MVEIRPVNTRRQFRAFLEFPLRLFKEVEAYVPPVYSDERDTLLEGKNPAYAFCKARMFLAYRDGRIVGRVMGIYNPRYNDIADAPYIRFSRFDFIDDQEVSLALLKAVEAYGKELGCTHIQGPIGFSDLDKQGMLVEGFDEVSMILTPYNLSYYVDHMIAHGYQKQADWIEYLVTTPDEPTPRLQAITKRVLERQGLTEINLTDKGTLRKYIGEFFTLYERCYSVLFGVMPLSKEQIQTAINQYIGFIDIRYISLLTDKEGKLVAGGVAMPSLAMASKRTNGKLFPFGFIRFLRALKKNDRLDLLIIAVAPEYQSKGLNGAVISLIEQRAIASGIRWAETGPMLEENFKVQSNWIHHRIRQHKRRRCWVKDIGH